MHAIFVAQTSIPRYRESTIQGGECANNTFVRSLMNRLDTWFIKLNCLSYSVGLSGNEDSHNSSYNFLFAGRLQLAKNNFVQMPRPIFFALLFLTRSFNERCKMRSSAHPPLIRRLKRGAMFLGIPSIPWAFTE